MVPPPMPAFRAHLDDGYDRAILVQGDEGPAQVVRLGHLALHQLYAATKFAARPIASIGPPEGTRRLPALRNYSVIAPRQRNLAAED
jgi:hypothetical protein